MVNPFMPTGAFNICCPRDAVSWTANIERTGRHKWVNIRKNSLSSREPNNLVTNSINWSFMVHFVMHVTAIARWREMVYKRKQKVNNYKIMFKNSNKS